MTGGSLDLEFLLIEEFPAPEPVDETEFGALAEFVLAAEGCTGAWEVSAVLVSDDRLQALHREFMDVDEPTDVMTFPRDDAFDAVAGGDIVISVERAADQAPAHGETTLTEIRFLLVHGLLHLAGWHDTTGELRTAMLNRQRELIADFLATDAQGA